MCAKFLTLLPRTKSVPGSDAKNLLRPKIKNMCLPCIRRINLKFCFSLRSLQVHKSYK